jgi:hypothetical protein
MNWSRAEHELIETVSKLKQRIAELEQLGIKAGEEIKHLRSCIRDQASDKVELTAPEKYPRNNNAMTTVLTSGNAEIQCPIKDLCKGLPSTELREGRPPAFIQDDNEGD